MRKAQPVETGRWGQCSAWYHHRAPGTQGANGTADMALWCFSILASSTVIPSIPAPWYCGIRHPSTLAPWHGGIQHPSNLAWWHSAPQHHGILAPWHSAFWHPGSLQPGIWHPGTVASSSSALWHPPSCHTDTLTPWHPVSSILVPWYSTPRWAHAGSALTRRTG